MTPPERHPSTDPREWLNRARSNLAQAGSRLPNVYLAETVVNWAANLL